MAKTVRRGRPSLGINCRLTIHVTRKDKAQLDNLCKELRMSNRETLCYLMNFENQYRSGATPEVRAHFASGAAAKKSESELKKNSKAVELNLSITPSDWQRYLRIFQLRNPLWAQKTHGENFVTLIDIAENSIENENNLAQNGTSSTKTLGERGRCHSPDHQSILALIPPSTPKVSKAAQITRPARAPAKQPRESSREKTPPFDSGRGKQKVVDHRITSVASKWSARFQQEFSESSFPEAVVILDRLDADIQNALSSNRPEPTAEAVDNEMPAAIGPAISQASLSTVSLEDQAPLSGTGEANHSDILPIPTQPALLPVTRSRRSRLIEPSRVLELTMEPSLWRAYSDFFERHNWMSKSDTEKVAILLEIAERHPDIAEDDADPLDVEEAVSTIKTWYDRLGDHHGSRPLCVKMPRNFCSDTLYLKVPLMESLYQRFTQFFLYGPNAASKPERKLEILLDLAKTHPSLVDRLTRMPPQEAQLSDSNRSRSTQLMSGKPRGPNLEMALERDAIEERTESFFATYGFSELDKEEKLKILLELAEDSLKKSDKADTLVRNSASLTNETSATYHAPESDQVSEIRAAATSRKFSIVAPKSLEDMYVNFFGKHGWSNKTNGEKLGILLGLAETHPKYAETTEIFDVREAISDCRLPCYNKQLENSSGEKITMDSETTWTTCIEMTRSLQNRAAEFFSTAGWTKMSNGEKLWMLLDLAQTHPYLNKGIASGPGYTQWIVSTTEDSRQKYDKFFAFHGWAALTHGQRLTILLQLAESHHALVDTEAAVDVKDKLTSYIRRLKNKKATERFAFKPEQGEEYTDDDSDGSWHDGVSPKKAKAVRATRKKKGMASDVSKMCIELSQELEQKYTKFFEKNGWGSHTVAMKLEILLQLGESHPDIAENWRDLPTFDILSVRVPSPFDKECQTDLAYCLRYQFTPFMKQRYSRFFENHGWGNANHPEQLNILLDLAETHPAFFECEQERPKFKKEAVQIKANVAANVDIDNGDHGEHRRKIRELKEAAGNQLQLLKPDYYLKFSEDARNEKPLGFKRSYAAMANTRRHIVERPQLKQLIARCACRHTGCDALIDYYSIRIAEIGFAIKATARCSNAPGHPFLWASSPLIQHKYNEKSSIYVLNTVVPAAIEMSGNQMTKMKHFARTLHLTWTNSKATNVAKGSCMSVVRNCFEMTQRSMLDSLKKTSGQVVLAGDGQFDSPGSCAKVCTYTLMVLGVDERKDDGGHQLKQCGYIINQAVIDCRHAESKSTNMERVGLHWALQPLIQSGVPVAELVTDDHIQIVADFRKIKAATQEQADNKAKGKKDDSALANFRATLSAALMHFKPSVDVDAQILPLLSFYADIVHSNDIWHKAKNILKAVSTIASSASSKEQPCYRRYAKMLRNYLWECAQGSAGNEKVFTELWTAVERHLKNDHKDCDRTSMHSKTKLMEKLDPSTSAFTRLITCIRRVASDAAQLCRFRKTGQLEAYNSLTLKYCPKRIALSYDVMVLRKDLAALDHNHHVHRAYKTTSDGGVGVSHRWTKSTKAYGLQFRKEDKDYAYLDHLMAAVLLHRNEAEPARYVLPTSAADPTRIQKTIAPKRQSIKESCAQWLSKQKAAANLVAKTVSQKNKKQKKKARSSSESGSSNSEDESWKSSDSKDEKSDDEWAPRTSSGAKKVNGKVKKTTAKRKRSQANFDEDDQQPLKKRRSRKPNQGIDDGSDYE